MRIEVILLTWIAGLVVTNSSLSQGFCVLENGGGCRDNGTGKVYIQEGNRLIDPKSGQIYMEIQPAPVSPKRPTITAPRRSSDPGVPVNPSTGRPYPVEIGIIDPAAESATGQVHPDSAVRSRSAVPPGQFQPHQGTSGGPINAQNGQFYPGPAGKIVNKNGQFQPH